MSDQDQTRTDEVLAAVPTPGDAVPAGVEVPAPGEAVSEPTKVEAQTLASDDTAQANATQTVPEHKGHREPRDLFGIQAFFTVVIFSIYVITFIVQAFQIPSGSMENTLLVGDFLLVDKLHYAGLPGSAHLLPY